MIDTPPDGDLHFAASGATAWFSCEPADALARATGLPLAVAYTMPFMPATGSPGNRYGDAGDLSFTWSARSKLALILYILTQGQ